MSLIKINKITQAEMSSKGVSALANKPNSHSAQYGHSGLSATELKAWFDKLGILLSSRLNDMIDMLAKAEACEHIAIPNDLLPQQEGELSLLDFLKAFSNGYMAYNIKTLKNEANPTLQSLQSLLFEIDQRISQNSESVDIQGGAIYDLLVLVNQNAEMCSSNSKDADGNIVSHKEILSKISSLNNKFSTGIANVSEFAATEVEHHNSSNSSHLDIRGELSTALEKAQEAYNLAAGKSKVHPMNDFDSFKSSIETESGRYNVGDVFMFKNKLLPDLILFEKDVVFDSSIDDFYLDDSPYLSEMEPGMTYFLYGNRFVSVESGIDVSKFATKDERLSDVLSLNSAIEMNYEKIQSLEEKSATKEEVEALEKEVAKKEEQMALYTDETSNIIRLQDYAEYDLGQRLELILELPEETSNIDCCIFNFYAGETPTALDAPESIYFVGDDTIDGRLYPVKNRGYEVNVKKLWGNFVARVGAFDFLIIEA